VTTRYDLVRKGRGATAARTSIEGLLGAFDVAPVDERVLRHAVALGWAAFEDGVCAAAADGAPDSPRARTGSGTQRSVIDGRSFSGTNRREWRWRSRTGTGPPRARTPIRPCA
jgi:hypothetical protein